MSEPSYEPYSPSDRPVPEERQPSASPHHGPDRGPFRMGVCGGSGALQTFLLASGICVAIWLMSGAGYFWPMWVMLGTGIPVVLSLTSGGAERGRRGWN